MLKVKVGFHGMFTNDFVIQYVKKMCLNERKIFNILTVYINILRVSTFLSKAIFMKTWRALFRPTYTFIFTMLLLLILFVILFLL